MGYKVNGEEIITNEGVVDAELGSKAVTELPDGTTVELSGDDELGIYDAQSGELKRFTLGEIDESGIIGGGSPSNINVETIQVTAASGIGMTVTTDVSIGGSMTAGTLYGDGSGLTGISAGSVASLDDIGDVDAPAPTNGQMLAYNTSTSEWEAVDPVAASLPAFPYNFVEDSNTWYSNLPTAPTMADGDILLDTSNPDGDGTIYAVITANDINGVNRSAAIDLGLGQPVAISLYYDGGFYRLTGNAFDAEPFYGPTWRGLLLVGSENTLPTGTVPSAGTSVSLAVDIIGLVDLASLDDIGDVNTPAPSNNEVLTYNSTTSEWEAQPAQTGSANQGGLQYTYSTNTGAGTALNGEIRFNGTQTTFGINVNDRNSVSQANFFSSIATGLDYLIYIAFDGGAGYFQGTYTDNTADTFRFTTGSFTGTLPGANDNVEVTITPTASSSVAALNDIGDVSTPSPSNDQVLTWTGSQWEAVSPTGAAAGPEGATGPQGPSGGVLEYAKLTKTSETESANVTFANRNAVKWDSQVFLSSGYTHSTSSNNDTVTVNNTGFYDITANIGLENDGANADRLNAKTSIWINGTEVTSSRGSIYSRGNSGVKNIKSNTVVSLTAGDTIEVYIWSDTVLGGVTINTIPAESELTITQISGAAAAAGPSGTNGTNGVNGGCEVGTIMAFGASTAPSGWFACDGASYDIVAELDLFNVIGYTYGGSGNDFNVPDLRGEFVRGWNNTSSGSDANRVFGSNQDDSMANHTHTQTAGGTDGFSGSVAGAAIETSAQNENTGETRPQNVALLYCIKSVANDIGTIGATGPSGGPAGPQGPQGATGADGPEGSAGSPLGTVSATAASSVPTNWLECDGTGLDTTTFSELFAEIGFTYGGSGATFNLPDLRGEFIRGWDNGKGTDSGRTVGSSQNDALEQHNHFLVQRSGTGSTPGVVESDFSSGSGFNSAFITGNVTNGTSSTETRPRNIAMMYIIKYQ